MNFFKNSIQKYHAKKLQDAIREREYHKSIKNKMDIKLKTENDDDIKKEIQKEIDNQNKLITIWENNIKKISSQLKKLE